MKNRHIHLDEDQLIYSVVDQNDLPAAVQNHLFGCKECQEKKQQLEQDLSNMARLANELAPLPHRKIRPLPQDSHRHWNWRPVFVAGFTALLLIFGIWRSSQLTIYHEYQMTKLFREMEGDQNLMVEIQALEENAMSDIYLEISGEPYSYSDDKFFEFVIPLEENQNTA